MLILTTALLLLKSSKIQTALVELVTEKLSKDTGTEFTIGKVDYHFLNHIEIDQIYIEDQQQDTLLFIDTLQLTFSFKRLLKKQVIVRELQLKHTCLNAYSIQGDTAQTMNYSFLLDQFSSDDNQQPASAQPFISLKGISIEDLRLRYNDFHLKNVNADLALNHYSADSLDAQINHLNANESKGFCLSDFQAHLLLNRQTVNIPRLKIRLPHSVLALHGSFTQPQTALADTTQSMFEQLFSTAGLRDANLLLSIDEADIMPSDIKRFVPQIRRLNDMVNIRGELSGKVKELHADNLAIDYNRQPILRGNVAAFGLPKLGTTFFQARLQDLQIDAPLLQDILSKINGEPTILPQEVARLGTMHYKGILNGRLDSLTLNGAFTSKLGSVNTKGSLLSDSVNHLIHFTGGISTPNFALGQMLAQNDLGNINMQVQLDATLGKDNTNANLQAAVNRLEYKQYTYHNLTIDGTYGDGQFDGQMQLNDPNLKFIFNGLADLTQELPILNFELDVDQLHLGKLNLSQKYNDMQIAGNLIINGSGNSLDNINGYLYLDSLQIQREETALLMQQLRILAETGEGEPTNFKIQSDYLNANFAGQYKYSELKNALLRIVAEYLPEIISEQTRQQLAATPARNKIDYYAYFKNLNEICAVLDLPIRIDKTPTIKGFIDETAPAFGLQVVVPAVRTNSQTFEEITLNLDNNKEQINLSAYAFKQAGNNLLGRRIGDLRTYLNLKAQHDSLDLKLRFDNTAPQATKGIIALKSKMSQLADKPHIDISLQPSTFLLYDTAWHISPANITYSAADTTITIKDMQLGNDNHYISIDGVAGRQADDSITIALKDIRLEYLMQFIDLQNAITFGGELTGDITAYSLLFKPMFDAELRMKEAQMNSEVIGDAHATAMLNREQKRIEILGDVVETGDTVATVLGEVDMQNGKWGINIYPDSIKLNFIDYWVHNFLGPVGGRGSGWVHVWGEHMHTWLEAKVVGHEANLAVPFINTRYYFSDSVIINQNNIQFDHIFLHDADGNNVLLNGEVRHDGSFKNMQYGIDISSLHAKVMDINYTKQAKFFGQVYATGDVSIQGNDAECVINANATTDPKTDFNLSLATASTARDNSFITFTDHHIVSNPDVIPEKKPKKKKPDTKMRLNLQVEATPDAQINIVINPSTGDALKARGSGNLRLEYDMNAEEINMFGAYTLESGTFNFSFENLIRREFTIRNGSTITFNGDPMNMQIDAAAQYATTASLRDLFGSDYSQVSTNRTTIPVNCLLYLKGNISNPVVSFGIELPQSDESVASQVKSIISTDEMMMREILYLLTFNRFYTPEYLQESTNNSLNNTYNLIGSTVTNQLNNWINKLTNRLTLGFNMRTDGEGSEASQEYETQFQYQPIDRLVINGNFGYRYNDISNQPVFGNLDVEYLISKSGMWRAKAYTHTVDKYSLREAHTVQGVGIMFKYDFNTDDKKAAPATQKPADNTPPADTIQQADTIQKPDTITNTDIP